MKALALMWWRWLVGHARGIWNAPAPSWAVPRWRPLDQLTLEQQIRRGKEARSLLDHPLFLEAASAVEDSLATMRRKVALGDQHAHTIVIMAGQQWEQFRVYIEQILVSGKLAEVDLLKKQSKFDQVRSALRRGLRV